MSPRLPVHLLLAGIVLLFTTVALGQDGSKGDLFVSPGGNDTWSGKLADPKPDGSDGPLATIGAARDAIRRIKTEGAIAGPFRVVIRGGDLSGGRSNRLLGRRLGQQGSADQIRGRGRRKTDHFRRPAHQWLEETGRRSDLDDYGA